MKSGQSFTQNWIQRILKTLFLLGFFSLFAVAAEAARPVDNQAIVVFEEHVKPQEISAFNREWRKQGVKTIRRLPRINGMILDVPDGFDINILSAVDGVKSAEFDQVIRLQSIGAASEGGASEGGASEGGASEGGANQLVVPVNVAPSQSSRSWAISWLHTYYFNYDNPTSIMASYNKYNVPTSVRYSNKGGVKIAVFDTGVDANHTQLNGVVQGGVDLINMPPGLSAAQINATNSAPWDDNGHGTHVTALIAGLYTGLGADFDVYSVKLLDQDASGSLVTLVTALEWAIANQMDVVNMSIAFRDNSPSVQAAIQAAYQDGLILVAAAGNHSNWHDDGGSSEGGASEGGASEGGASEGGASEGGASEGGASATGTGALVYSVMYPAAYPEVIAVGATDIAGNMAWYSNEGPELDLLAPGSSIVSALNGGGYGKSSGTSMAAPLVTSTIAMMLIYDDLLEGKALGDTPSTWRTESVRDFLVYGAYPVNSDVGELDLIYTLYLVSQFQ